MTKPTLGRNVLVIDDARDMADLLSTIFRTSFECNVTETLLVHKAIKQIQTIKSDLVVTDFQMPNGGGIAIARTLIKTQPATPLIFSREPICQMRFGLKT